MAFESKQGFIKSMFGLFIYIAIRSTVAIVKVGLLLRGLCFNEIIKCCHFANIPNFKQLVFCVGCYIYSVKFAANIGYPFCMPHENTNRPASWQRPPIPDLYKSVVTAAEKNVTMLSVSEANRVDLISMRPLHSCANFVRNEVKTNNFAAFRSTYQFFTISAVLARHNCSLPLLPQVENLHLAL